MLKHVCLVAALAWGGLATAEEDENVRAKFTLDGAQLTYDTRAVDAEIDEADVDVLRELLRANPAVTALVLDSGGGSVWASMEMARVIMDFELDTSVSGECSSSCVNMLLAGSTRQMQRGAKIGFHQWTWSAESMESYYKRRREIEDWETPFEFGSWSYEDAQTETYNDLKYYLSRGVAAEFAIEMKAPRPSLWYPNRAELQQAGILTE